jgi:hypothetical protein
MDSIPELYEIMGVSKPSGAGLATELALPLALTIAPVDDAKTAYVAQSTLRATAAPFVPQVAKPALPRCPDCQQVIHAGPKLLPDRIGVQCEVCNRLFHSSCIDSNCLTCLECAEDGSLAQRVPAKRRISKPTPPTSPSVAAPSDPVATSNDATSTPPSEGPTGGAEPSATFVPPFGYDSKQLSFAHIPRRPKPLGHGTATHDHVQYNEYVGERQTKSSLMSTYRR